MRGGTPGEGICHRDLAVRIEVDEVVACEPCESPLRFIAEPRGNVVQLCPTRAALAPETAEDPEVELSLAFLEARKPGCSELGARDPGPRKHRGHPLGKAWVRWRASGRALTRRPL
jgi:hypothetical protein